MENLKAKASKCIEFIKEKGIEKAICSVSSNVISEFNADGGEFSLFRTLFDNSLSVTVYNKGRKGFVSVNRIDDDSISRAVENCISASESATPDEAWDVAPVTENAAFVKGCPEPDVDRLFERTEELMRDIASRHPLIIIEQMIVKHIRGESAYRNSNGVEYNTLYGEYSIELMFSAHEGSLSSSFYGSGVCTDTLEKSFITLGSIEEDLANVEKQIRTVPIEGKFIGTVLFPPQSLASVLYSALGNFCGNTTILDGTSIWKEELNKKVADERITVTSAPLDDRIICGEMFTSEGFRSENYYIIKEGILKSFMLSYYVANKTGRDRAKNASASFIMSPGDISVSDIIKGIDKGIIVGRLSGGEPSTNGDFTGVAKNSFYIENGKIVNAVSETMISGNLADLMKNLRAISSEVICDGATVLPYAAFDNVTISGK